MATLGELIGRTLVQLERAIKMMEDKKSLDEVDVRKLTDLSKALLELKSKSPDTTTDLRQLPLTELLKLSTEASRLVRKMKKDKKPDGRANNKGNLPAHMKQKKSPLPPPHND